MIEYLNSNFFALRSSTICLQVEAKCDAVGWWLQEKRAPLSGGPCGKARMTDVKGSHEAEGWRAGPAGTPGPADRQDGSAEASANPAGSVVGPHRKKDSPSSSPRDDLWWAAFLFLYYFKMFLQKYIFGFIFYSFILLPPGRGGRDLHVNKYLERGGAAGSPPARQAARPPGRGAVGSPPNIKTEPLPSHPHFLPTRSREGRGREEG